MQAIKVHFLPPTNHKDARVVATCKAGRKVMPCSSRLEPHQNADRVAMALASSLGWTDERYYGPIHRGTIPNGDYVYVITNTVDADTKSGESTRVGPEVLNDNRLMSPMNKFLLDIYNGKGPGFPGNAELFAKAKSRGWIRKSENGYMYVTKRGKQHMFMHGIIEGY